MKSKDFLERLKDISRELQADIDAHCNDWDNDPAAIKERVAKVKDKVTGFEYFVTHYFPHYLRNPTQSHLHEYLFKRLPQILSSERSELDALAAPRGEAKSTIVTRLFALYCIVTDQKKYIAIISDSIDQSAEFLQAIKTELEVNPRISTDFPKVVGAGRVWQAYTIHTANNIKVQCAGARKKMRGWVFGAYRPDLVLLDDLENDENVESPDQRDKLHKWLLRTPLKLAAAGEKMDVVYIGTILHHDSVLNRILKNKGWTTRVFKALLEWPDNMKLWDEWEAIYHDEGEDAAVAYYQKHKRKMDKGAVVSWDARPVLALMIIRARDGHSNFDSELQNDPAAGEDAPFSDSITYWRELPAGLVYFAALDPSLGKKGSKRKKGDPSAIAIGGYDRLNGKLHVVIADIQRRTPDKIISDVIRYQKEYPQILGWAIESIAFQEFLRTEIVKRSAAAGIHVPAIPVMPHGDKLLRIEALQPHMANGLLLLHHKQKALIAQFTHFPKHENDDGPDAVEMLWKLSTSFARASNTPVQALHVPTPSLYDHY
ncbi:phage terminase large subunit [Psychrobacter sp. T6-1]|uniref:phage terminase large subunit n=1 Tax=Psychrobacter sp. T6-1 TaxID=3457447 RepID=UPI003FD276ED